MSNGTGNRWTPGHRAAQSKRNKTSPIVRLATTNVHTLSVYVGELTKDDESVAAEANRGLSPEIQEKDIVLTFDKGSDYFSSMLTNFREDELLCLKEVIDFGFEKALFVARERDAVARKALEVGDNTYRRMHRGTPKVSYIQRRSGSDSKELPERSEPVLPGNPED